ncbi:DUF362 domain-containing protein [Candidatus Woesearchaeota archaeon]|nr:DUF362 domain-containing protein [Candidatus Woesearchaeota archaeon]
MPEVHYLEDAESSKLEEALESGLEEAGFKRGMTVAVKLHMGEGKGMFRPEIAKRAVSVLLKIGCKPFLFDTIVMYPGPRHIKAGYKANAMLHGFTEKKIGCPVVISDEFVLVKTAHMEAEVSKEMAGADAMLVLTHFKGHDCASFGGSIKNLGMGCASPKTKRDQHSLGQPVVNDNCIACGICEKVCPFHAIKVSDKCHISYSRCMGCDTCHYNCPHGALDIKVSFEALLCEAAAAALQPFDKKPVFFLNDVRNITKHCDCFPFPGDPVAKDVGVLLSKDIVAIDQASLDLSNKQEGKNFFKLLHHHDPYLSTKEAERQGMGKQEYSLEKI